MSSPPENGFKSTYNPNNLNDVENTINSNSTSIDINTGSLESNTPLEKTHTITINTTVNKVSIDVSSPPEYLFRS